MSDQQPNPDITLEGPRIEGLLKKVKETCTDLTTLPQLQALVEQHVFEADRKSLPDSKPTEKRDFHFVVIFTLDVAQNAARSDTGYQTKRKSLMILNAFAKVGSLIPLLSHSMVYADKMAFQLEEDTLLGHVCTMVQSWYAYPSNIRAISDAWRRPDSPEGRQIMKEHRKLNSACIRDIRSFFAVFLNSQHSSVRSTALGWTTCSITKNRPKISPAFELLDLLVPFQGRKRISQPFFQEFSQVDRSSLVDGGAAAPAVKLSLRHLTKAETLAVRDLLSQLASPLFLVVLCRVYCEMVQTLMQTGHQYASFALGSAVLMPNMLALSRRIRLGATSGQIAQLQRDRRAAFPRFAQEDKDSATRGFLLLISIELFEIGCLPELALIKNLRNLKPTAADQDYIQEQLFLREMMLLDPRFVSGALDMWIFVVGMLQYDLQNRMEEVRVYPESILLTMSNFFILIAEVADDSSPFTERQAELAQCCSGALDILVADHCISSVRTRSSIVRWLHSWTQAQSPLWMADKSHLFDTPQLAAKLASHLSQFAVQLTDATSPDESDPSMAAIQCRSLLTFLWDRRQFKAARQTQVFWSTWPSVFSCWLLEIQSYLQAMLNTVQMIRKHEIKEALLPPARLAQLKTRAKIFGIDCHNFLLLLVSSSKTHPDALRSINDRIAEFSFFALDYLVSSKCEQLVVNCSREIHFSPKALVSLICQLWLQMRSPTFCAALAIQEWYCPKIIKQTDNVLRLHCSPPAVVGSEFKQLVEEVLRMYRTIGSIPEAFLDALLNRVMKDPVMLPCSEKIVDRETIARSLKNKAVDPYTSQPLSIENLIPQNELKAKLDDFWNLLAESREKPKPEGSSDSDSLAIVIQS